MSNYKKMMTLTMLAWGLGQVSSARADAPNCYPYGATGYCEYHGTVSQAYVNAYNQIIFYFDTPFDPSSAAAVGLTGVSSNNAAIYNTTTNPDFGKALLASMLSAQARGARVRVQMMSVWSGYLVIDRIWVSE